VIVEDEYVGEFATEGKKRRIGVSGGSSLDKFTIVGTSNAWTEVT